MSGGVDSEYADGADGLEPEVTPVDQAELEKVAAEAAVRPHVHEDAMDEDVEVEYRPLHGELYRVY